MQLIPRLLIPGTLLLLASQALASEVVWVDPAPSPAEVERVALAAGAKAQPLEPIALRSAASAWGPADDAAYQVLDDTLRDVRAFETRLDGELLIMRDLDAPIAQITVVRGEADRERLFDALVYEGFAVDRFFMEKLGSDERAASYRTDVAGTVVERPWLDAVALDPEREITAYEVAEAPQRVAYEEARTLVRAALPAEIRAPNLPADVVLSIDGRVPKPGANGGYRVVPGRHLVHAEKDGVILARWDLRLTSASQAEVTLPVTDADWTTFLDGVRSGATPAVPEGLRPSIAALGGEVWLARVDDKGGVSALKLTEAGLEPVELPRGEGDHRWSSGFSLAGTIGAGWMYSGDFYGQDPANAPHTVATVNAATTNLGAEVAWDVRLFRAVAGLDATYTYGDFHYALYGDKSTRVRLTPYIGAGIRWVQAYFGFLFPYHPVGGLIGGFKITKGLEFRAAIYAGGSNPIPREGGDPYTTYAIGGLWAGVGYRFGLGPH